MSTIKNVIVVGATGNTGASVLQSLQLNPQFSVSVLTRGVSTPKIKPPPDTRVITADYTSLESLAAAFAGQDAVVSAIARDNALDQRILIDAAIKAGVKRFIPAEFGANNQGKSGELAVFQGKVVIREYLVKKAAEGKITWTGIANGAVLDLSLKSGIFGFNIPEKKVTRYDGGNVRFSTSLSAVLGTAVVGVLTHPKETENKYLYVQSTSTTQNELLALYERLTDTKWEVEEASTAELEKVTNEKLAKGDRSTIYNLIYRCCYAEGYGNEFEELSNELLGIQQLDAKALEKVIKNTL